RLGGFVGATDSERRTLILRAKGADRSAPMAPRARQHAADTQQHPPLLRTRLADALERYPLTVADARAEYKQAQDADDATATELKDLRASLAVVEAQALEFDALQRAIDEAAAQRVALETRIEAATQERAALGAAISAIEGALDPDVEA